LGVPIKRYLIDNGVDTRYLLESDAPSTVAFVEEHDGNAHFQFMNSGAADTQYDPRPRPNLPDSVRFMQFGAVSLLSEPTSTSITEIVAAHCARTITVFDPNCRPALTKDRDAYRATMLRKWVPLTHILKISDQDLAWLEPGRDHAELAQTWLALGPSVVIVTAGEKGATLYRNGHAPIHVTPPTIQVVDTVGAGDTFTANMMVRLLQLGVQSLDAVISLSDAHWRDVMTYAVKAAAINCTRAGANPPTLAEMSE
ncbi:MAG: carbohydrate kinase, partial [Anaerolineae bacterium]|nr:carbohydrate kinase [Anaerolineae bacterium]